MAVTTYNNIQSNVQSTIHSIISDNITSTTANIIDGTPTNLIRGHGFPYILIRTPTVSDTLPVFRSNLSEVIITTDIEVWTKQESLARTLSDSVRQHLRASANITTFETAKLFRQKIDSSDLTSFILEDETVAYRILLRVRMHFGG